MSSKSENPTIDIREGEELDIAAIDKVLKDAVPGLSGAPKVTQYPSGNSNLTYAIDYPNRRLVMRRPPFGTLPKSGHSMIREYTIMSKLKPVFPAVPNCVYYASAEDSVIGAEFYVMDRVDGHLIHTSIPKDWDWGEAETRTLCENTFQSLVDLHTLDYKAAGLSDFGKPEGYVERQIGGWNKRYERVITDDVDAFEDVRKWLFDNMPGGEVAHSIVHGDFRIDNFILNLEDPRKIDAVLDWEISALGDPLMDLGVTLSYWIEASDPPQLAAMNRQPSTAPGMLSRDDILKFYLERTDYKCDDFRFYYVYGLFRMCGILQQIYYRYYHGQTTNKMFAGFGMAVNGIGQMCRKQIAAG